MPALLDVNETVITGTGFLWIAPKSANPVLPVDVGDLDSLDPAFVPLGYTTKADGFKFTVTNTITSYDAMQSLLPIDQRVTAQSAKFVAKMLQITQETVIAAFGGGTWTTTANGTRFDPPAIGAAPDKFVVVSKVIDGDKIIGLVVANGIAAAATIDIVDIQGQMKNLPLEVTALADNNVPNGFYQLLDTPGTVVLVNEVQLFTLTGIPTGGTFAATINGVAVTLIPFNATVVQFQARVNLTSLKNAILIGGTVGAWTVTGEGALAGVNIPTSTIDPALLTGGTSPTVAVTTTTQGAPE